MEENAGEVVKSRKERIIRWLKDPYNLAFIGIILAAFAIRLYYLFVTKNQALWWDEAEYGLRANAFAFGTPLTGWAPERELVVPFLYSLFLRVGLNELGLKFLQILVSVGTVAMSYLLMSRVANRKIGVITSFGVAFFWLHIFFSERLLLYLWAPLLYLIIVYFFYTGYMKENKRDLYLFAIFASIGLQIYFSIGFLLLALFVFIFLNEGFSLFINKKVWKVALIFIIVLLPYAIYSQITFGFPIPRMAVGLTAATQESGAGLAGLTAYIQMFPSRIGLVFFILSLLGIVYFLFNFLIGLGIKDHIKTNSNWLLIFSSFFIPLFLYTLYGVIGGSGTFYDAFILPVFPFYFAFAGLFIEEFAKFMSKYGKVLTAIIIIILLGVQVYLAVSLSNQRITASMTSYDSVKSAGLWIKDNSNPEDIIISRSLPQNTYYSQRRTYSYPDTEEEMESFILEKKPKFIIDSIWENTEQWIHEYPAKHNSTLTPIQVYFIDKEQKQPSLIIFEVNYPA